MARRRNQRHTDKVRFIAASLEEADLGDEVYDKVFGIHVRALERPGAALDTVRRRLVPSGHLYLFSRAPGWNSPAHAEAFGTELADTLEESGLEIGETLVKDLGSGFAAAVVARTSQVA